MRYLTNQKEVTRKHIISVATKLIKVRGIDNTGIALIMQKANLTNGAFYAHFASKEDLIATIVHNELTTQLELFKSQLGGVEGLKKIIDLYLSEEHLRNCANGCPSAALLGELSKREAPIRENYTSGLKAISDELIASINTSGANDNHIILALLGLLIGTVQLARTVTDEVYAQDIVKAGHSAAYALIDTSLSR